MSMFIFIIFLTLRKFLHVWCNIVITLSVHHHTAEACASVTDDTWQLISTATQVNLAKHQLGSSWKHFALTMLA